MGGATEGGGEESGLLSCPLCLAGIRDREIDRVEELRCGRCDTLVKKHEGEASMQTAWALATTGLVLAVLANLYPVLVFEVAGNAQSTLIITGVRGLREQGYWPVAVLVFFCAVAAPLVHFLAVWYVAASCCLGRRWPMVVRVAHLAERIEPWSLMPVFAIACVVSVVKLDMLGNVEWRAGMLWVVLFSICSVAMSQVFDPDRVERILER